MKKYNSKNIHFKSTKDYLFSFIILGTNFLLFGMVFFILLNASMSEDYIGAIFLLATNLFLLWTFFGTRYQLSIKELKCFCGPFQKTIKIDSIVSIKVGTTMWSGYRLATSRNGIIITYNKYDDVYISPKTNEEFVKKLLEFNPNIIIKK